jgi:hypothetical protein
MDEPTIVNPEIAAAYRALSGVVERLVATTDGLTPDQLNWRPPVAGGNSVTVLAVHTLANIEESVLEVLGGQPVGRIRDEEFVARNLAAEALRNRQAEIMTKVRAVLATLPANTWDREYTHPRRGLMTGRDVLLLVLHHAAEHLGHAELTRDWINAAGSQE